MPFHTRLRRPGTRNAGAVALTVAAVLALVVLGGRVYRHAILHTGGVLRLTDAWRGIVTSRAR